jgi:hypothetical protein
MVTNGITLIRTFKKIGPLVQKLYINAGSYPKRFPSELRGRRLKEKCNNALSPVLCPTGYNNVSRSSEISYGKI